MSKVVNSCLSCHRLLFILRADDPSVLDLTDVSMYPNLFAELIRRNYTDNDIRRIARALTFHLSIGTQTHAWLHA